MADSDSSPPTPAPADANSSSAYSPYDQKNALILATQNAGNINFIKGQLTDTASVKTDIAGMKTQISQLQQQVNSIASQQAQSAPGAGPPADISGAN